MCLCGEEMEFSRWMQKGFEEDKRMGGWVCCIGGKYRTVIWNTDNAYFR